MNMHRHIKGILFAVLVLTAVMICSFALATDTAHEVHVWSEWYQVSSATCQQRAQWQRTCSICGATDTDFRGDFAAHIWNYNSPEIVFVNCTSVQNVYYYCSVCGHRSEVMNTLPAPGHKFGDWVRTQNPTCVAEGQDSHTCSVCGFSETKTVPATGAHNWSNWFVTTPATCETAGTQTRNCLVCGKADTQAIPALGHIWGAWAVSTPATCNAAGERIRVCGRDGNHVERQTIPVDPNAHTFGSWTVTKEPGCTTTGIRSCVCTTCGKEITETIPPTGHTFGPWQVIRPASCDEPGLEQHECTACGLIEERPISMTSHSWGPWTVRVPATCQDTGTEVRTCNICGLAEERYTPVGSHNWGPWIMDVEPTCTEAGHRYHVCSVCNTREEEIIPPLGHVWTDWVTVIEPSDDTTGIEQHMCPVCGTVETRQIGVVGGSSTMCTFGPRLVDMGDQLAPASNKWYMFTPFDISMNGTQTYELVVDNQYIVGSLTLVVHNGNLTVNYKVDSPYLRVDLEFFTILDTIHLLSQYEPEELAPEYGLQPGRTYSLAQLNIPYDSELCLYFCSRVTYTYDAVNMRALNYGSSIHQAQLNAMLAIMD